MSDNRLIAEFMGINFADRKDISSHCYINGKVHYENDLRYHDDWNWLMKVVERINEEVAAGRVVYDIHHALKSADIGLAYAAVVEFINWYNERGAR